MFSFGFKEFDVEILEYYYQVSDEVDIIDYDYLMKYCKVFVYSCCVIVDSFKKLIWVSGDKYEEVGKELYGN